MHRLSVIQLHAFLHLKPFSSRQTAKGNKRKKSDHRRHLGLRAASSAQGNFWRSGGRAWGGIPEQRCDATESSRQKQLFSPGDLVSVVWRSVLIPGDLQASPGAWQPWSASELECNADKKKSLRPYHKQCRIWLTKVMLQKQDDIYK